MLYAKGGTMIALIDQYRKELLMVNGFAASTVDTYTISFMMC